MIPEAVAGQIHRRKPLSLVFFIIIENVCYRFCKLVVIPVSDAVSPECKLSSDLVIEIVYYVAVGR